MCKSLTKLRENAGVIKIASTWAFEKLHWSIFKHFNQHRKISFLNEIPTGDKNGFITRIQNEENNPYLYSAEPSTYIDGKTSSLCWVGFKRIFFQIAGN